MDTDRSWMSDLLDSWGEPLTNIGQHLPGLLGAIAVLIIGYVLARLARRAVRLLANAMNRFLSRQLAAGQIAQVRVSPLMITLLAEITFWVTIVIASILALRVAGVGVGAQWLDRIAVYVPNLMAALIILVVGFLLSIFVREQLKPHADEPGTTSRQAWLASAAQGFIVVVTLLVGLDQLGVSVNLLIALTIVGAAGIALTLGASFALGSRQHAANLIGMRTARSQLSVGQRLRIGEVEGLVVEFSATQIVLDTDQGRVLMPGHYLEEQVATILYRDAKGESHHG